MSIRPGQAKGPWVGKSAGAPPIPDDHKVANSAIDTTPDYLSSKVVTQPNSGILLTTLNPGANEQLQVEVDGSLFDDTMVSITGNDQTTGFLATKLVPGPGVSMTVVNPGLSETLRVDVTVPPDTNDKVKVSALDALTEYLKDKITAAGGITATTYDKGAGIEAISINGSGVVGTTTGANVGTGTGQVFRDKTSGSINLKTIKAGTNITSVVNNADDITINASTQVADHLTIVSGTDTTPGNLVSKISGEGIQITTESPAGDESLDIRALPGFFDDFYQSRPFWQGTQALTSGDFTVDTVNHWLAGAAQNNQEDWIRTGIEGDFDFKIKLNTNGASSGGFHLSGNSNTVTWKLVPGSTVIERIATGEANTTYAYATTTVWLRITREARVLKFYHRVGDTDKWTLDNTLTKDLGYDVKLSLDSMTNGRILYIYLWDNTFPERVKQDCGKRIPLADGATITPDLRMGNIFTVTLGGNRTIGAPTDPQVRDGSMFILRLRQDASPPRTVTWNAIYRFPGGTAPTLTAVANKTDYFGFIFNEVDTKYDCIAQEFNL